MVIPTVLKNIIEPFLHTSSHSYVLPGLAFLVRAPRVSKSSQLSTKFFVDKTDVANDDIGSLHSSWIGLKSNRDLLLSKLFQSGEKLVSVALVPN